VASCPPRSRWTLLARPAPRRSHHGAGSETDSPGPLTWRAHRISAPCGEPRCPAPASASGAPIGGQRNLIRPTRPASKGAFRDQERVLMRSSTAANHSYIGQPSSIMTSDVLKFQTAARGLPWRHRRAKPLTLDPPGHFSRVAVELHRKGRLSTETSPGCRCFHATISRRRRLTAPPSSVFGIDPPRLVSGHGLRVVTVRTMRRHILRSQIRVRRDLAANRPARKPVCNTSIPAIIAIDSFARRLDVAVAARIAAQRGPRCAEDNQ